MDDTITGGDISAAVAASEASPASQPSGVTPNADLSAGTTTPPADPSTPGVSSTTAPQAQAGVPPEHRWPTILENQRREAAAAAEAKWKEQYGWAEQVDRAAVEQAVQLANRFNGDRVQFLQDLIAEAQQDPQTAAQLRSMAARALAAGRGQGGTPEDNGPPAPDVAITDAQGNVVGQTYSAESLARRDRWLIQQVMSQVEQKYAPVVQTAEEVKQEREALRRQTAAHDFGTTAMKDITTWPLMSMTEADKPHRVAVAARTQQLLATLPRDRQDDPREITIAVNRAWREVCLPKLQATKQHAEVHDINQRASAATVNPNAPSTSAPKDIKDMSWAEALRHGVANMAR